MPNRQNLTEAVNELIGPPPQQTEGEKIDYEKTKAPNFSSENQPKKKKKKKNKD